MTTQVKELFNKHRNLLIPLLVAVSSVVIITLVIVPQLFSLLGDQDRSTQLENKSLLLQVKAKELSQIDQELYQKNLDAVLRALPTDREVPESLVILQNLIVSSGLSLEGMKYLSGAASAQKNYQLEVALAGSFEGLRSLLDGLADSPRIFRVEQIETQSGNDGNISSQIIVSAFFEPLPATIGDLEQPVPQLSEADKQLLEKLSKFGQTTTDLGGVNVPLGKTDPFE